MSGDFTYVRMKNIFANEFLIAESMHEIDNDENSQFRVACLQIEYIVMPLNGH